MTTTLTSKRCRACGETKPLDEFHRQAANKGDGRRGRCKPCTRKYEHARRYLRPYELGQIRAKARYGMDPAEYQRLADTAACEICGERPEGRRLCIDHDHETGAIRGMLCFLCNTGLGRFRDDAEVLEAAARYLRRAEQ